jgi:hypothetical protein
MKNDVQIKWKALLRKMKLDHIKRTAPGFYELSGGQKFKVNPYNDHQANSLTRCVIDFINHFPDGVGEASRINSTGTPRKMADGSIKWTKGSTRKGIADIKGTFKGRALNIEIKIGKDRQSDHQIKEQERITKAGGIYWIVKSFPDFLEQWQAAGFEIPQFENIKA